MQLLFWWYKNKNYIKMHAINNLKTHQPKVTTNTVTDGNNCSRFLRDNCLVTFKNENNAAGKTSLNKEPTGSWSRIVGHKQAWEEAYCYLPSVCSGNWNSWCADMRSLNSSSECYLVFTVFCPTRKVKWLNVYRVIRTVTVYRKFWY